MYIYIYIQTDPPILFSDLFFGVQRMVASEEPTNHVNPTWAFRCGRFPPKSNANTRAKSAWMLPVGWVHRILPPPPFFFYHYVLPLVLIKHGTWKFVSWYVSLSKLALFKAALKGELIHPTAINRNPERCVPRSQREQTIPISAQAESKPACFDRFS